MKRFLTWDNAVWAVVALAAVLYFAGLGSYPLTDRDEGEYASTASAMRRSGDYVIPTLNGRNYIEKPILIFWLVAGSQNLFGANEFATRLPSTAAAILLLMAFALLVRKATGRADLAVIATGLLAFCPLFTMVARACLTDMVLTLFTTSSLLMFFIAMETGKPRDRLWYCLSWACLSLGFLTKGPVAVAVILPTACAYALLQRRFVDALLRSSILLGAVIFLVINLPWFGMAFHRLGLEFWNGFFVSQNATRFFSVLLGHGGGPLYYVPVLLLGAFPCSAAGVPALWFAARRNSFECRKQDVGRRLLTLSVVAVAVVFAVFSIAATKLPHYILPAFPFFSLAAAYLLLDFDGSENIQHKGLRKTFWILLAVMCAILAAAALAAPSVAAYYWNDFPRLIRPDSSEYAFADAPPCLGALPFLLAATIIALLLTAVLLRKLRGYAGVAAAMCGVGLLACAVGIVAGVTALMPQHTPGITMAKEVKGVLRDGSELVTFGLWKPTLFFYMDRNIRRMRFKEDDDFEDLKDLLASKKPVFVMTRTTLWGKMAESPDALRIAQYDGYLLCGNEKAAEQWTCSAVNK